VENRVPVISPGVVNVPCGYGWGFQEIQTFTYIHNVENGGK
jgi:hypothetical protein